MGGEGLKIDLPVSHVFYKASGEGNTLYIANNSFTIVRTVNEFIQRTGGTGIKRYAIPRGTVIDNKCERVWCLENDCDYLENVGEVYNQYASEKGLKSKSVFETPRDLYDFERYLRDEKYLKNDNLLEF